MGTVGGGVDKQGYSAFGAKTTGTSGPKLLSKLKEKYPKKSGIFKVTAYGFLFIGFLIAGIGGFFDKTSDGGTVTASIFMIVVAVLILGAFSRAIISRKTFDERVERYKRTWYCFSCGKYTLFKS